MRAFVLCAGLGTRLRPLTYILPKALLPVWGKSIIFHIFKHLGSIGVKDIIINLHHLPDKIMDVLGNGSGFNLKIRYSFEKRLLDTGGGLKKVEWFLKHGTFIMYNCDVVTNVNLKKMLAFHKRNNNIVTLLASSKHEPKHLFVDREGRVVSIKRKGNYAFCGVHIIEPFIFKFIPEKKPISIISIYKWLIENGIPVNIYPLGKAFWHEAGNVKSYNRINNLCYRNI